MFYLYVKTHNKTGLKYLGQTRQDPNIYTGSGKYWKLHLLKHGVDHLTEILYETNDKDDLKKWGLYYSILWNVVDSNEWANLKPESGDGGWPRRYGHVQTLETRKKISDKKRGVPAPWAAHQLNDEHKEKLRKANLGKKLTAETKEKMSNSRIGKKHNVVSIEKMKIPKTQDAKENMATAQKLRRSIIKEMHITNGSKNRIIPIGDEIPIGWYKGRANVTTTPSQKGKIWINNGTENKMAMSVIDGWKKGRIKK